MSRFAARRARRVPVPPLTWAVLRQIPAPYGPDPYVFGPPLPPDADLRVLDCVPYRPEGSCPHHPGVSWRGETDCWMCKP